MEVKSLQNDIGILSEQNIKLEEQLEAFSNLSAQKMLLLINLKSLNQLNKRKTWDFHRHVQQHALRIYHHMCLMNMMDMCVKDTLRKVVNVILIQLLRMQRCTSVKWHIGIPLLILLIHLVEQPVLLLDLTTLDYPIPERYSIQRRTLLMKWKSYYQNRKNTRRIASSCDGKNCCIAI